MLFSQEFSNIIGISQLLLDNCQVLGINFTFYHHYHTNFDHHLISSTISFINLIRIRSELFQARSHLKIDTNKNNISWKTLLFFNFISRFRLIYDSRTRWLLNIYQQNVFKYKYFALRELSQLHGWVKDCCHLCIEWDQEIGCNVDNISYISYFFLI